MAGCISVALSITTADTHADLPITRYMLVQREGAGTKHLYLDDQEPRSRGQHVHATVIYRGGNLLEAIPMSLHLRRLILALPLSNLWLEYEQPTRSQTTLQ